MYGAWRPAGLIILLLLLATPALAQPTGLPDDLSGDAEAQGFADLLFAHGMVELADLNYRAALPLFEKAARTLPSDATYAYFVALCQLRLGRVAEAVDGFKAVLPPAVGRVEEARIRFDLGDGYYRMGDRQAARRELRRSTSLNDQFGSAHFYLGLLEFAAGDTSAAFDGFGKASAVDPQLTEGSAYESGMAAYERGELEAARGYFEQVMQAVTGPDTLDHAGKVGALSQGDLRINFSLEHDDNPGQISDEVVLPGVGSDLRAVATLRAAYRPKISKADNTVGLVLNSYVSRHDDFDDADLAGIQGVFQYVYGSDPVGFITGPLGYSRAPTGKRPFAWMFQAGASNLARTTGTLRRDYEVASTFLVHQPGFGKIEFSVSYDDVTFIDELSADYSGHNTTTRLGQTFFLGKSPGRSLRLLVGRTTHDTRLPELDRDSDVLQAELVLPLNPRFNLFLLGAIRQDDYAPESAAFYPEIDHAREDETFEAIAKLSMNLKAGALSFRYSFADRDSKGLNFASYDRRISSFGYTRQW